MTTTSSAVPVELIAVRRHPNIAKKIPVVARIPHDNDEQRLMEKWRGTTPQGREIIRKKLWALERQLLTQNFDHHWPKIESMLPDGLLAMVGREQDETVGERIRNHLTRTRRWVTYRESVAHCVAAFAKL